MSKRKKHNRFKPYPTASATADRELDTSDSFANPSMSSASSPQATALVDGQSAGQSLPHAPSLPTEPTVGEKSTSVPVFVEPLLHKAEAALIEPMQHFEEDPHHKEVLQRIEGDIALLMQVGRNLQRRLSSLEKPIAEISTKLSATLPASPPSLASPTAPDNSALVASQQAEIKALKQQLADISTRLQRSQRERDVYRSRVAAALEKSDRIKNHLSYKIGHAIVNDSKTLSGALRLPFTLWKISHEWKLKHKKSNAIDNIPVEIIEPIMARDSADANLSFGKSEAISSQAPTITPTGKLKVAAICDEFTYHCFAPECDLLQLHATHWAEQIEKFKPDLVFIESAWRGFGETWAGKVSTISDELENLVNTARRMHVPVAFWCKEDPVHFQRFLPVAKLADAVFTTDIDCIPRYQRELGHKRVYLLPFAAQPLLHNPIQSIPRETGFSFAGSYYNKYKQRCQDFEALISAAKALGNITIYDRNADRPQPHDFNYPEAYRPYIKGNLPYTEIDKAYKGYDFGITVNTIKHSQTMFARRAFELMASNTIVVSNFSRGIRRFFQESVIASDSAGTVQKELRRLFPDDASIRRYRMQALRVVLCQHTYAHRLSYVSKKLGIKSKLEAPRWPVLAFGLARNAAEVARLIASFQRQQTSQAKYAILCPPEIFGSNKNGVERVDNYQQLANLAKDFTYIAAFSPSDYYGADYLADFLLSTTFSQNAPALTKYAYFRQNSASGLELANKGSQYRHVQSIKPFSSLVRSSLFSKLWDTAKKSVSNKDIACPDALAVDEFSYCYGINRDLTDGEDYTINVPRSSDYDAYERIILRTAETLDVADDGWDEQKFIYENNTWVTHLPSKAPPGLKLARHDDGKLFIDSSLADGSHKYIYLDSPLSVESLPSADEGSFLAEGKTHGDVRLVLVFLDEHGKKISHLMQIVGRLGNLAIPAGTAKVQVGFRISGPAKASLGDIEFKAAERRTASVISRGEALIISYQYPDYNDLYKYGFVHSRLRAYHDQGFRTDVIRYQRLGEYTYREYEGIDITDANIASIQAAYSSGAYRHVGVHVLSEPELWDCIKDHLDSVATTIWVHGSEIQPWWRRASNYSTDARRAKAQASSNLRVDMWREVLTTKHPNLRIVFVSRSQYQMALRDLGLSHSEIGKIHVIGNYINSQKFVYSPKPDVQRKRILSIRPYVSSVYANDLAVKAVLELANRPIFSELEFLFIGDGPLFDETLSGIKHFSNVKIEKGFIPQDKIAELHKDYGVFLVPTRMDSQGVSRDEAMASGLVPVTNAVAAVPEFTDPSCAFAVPPEDYIALADAVEKLATDQDLFQRMSAAAAARVRHQSSIEQTISKEIQLLQGATSLAATEENSNCPQTQDFRIAIYGDVNLNIMDGSAVWAASVGEVLAGLPNADTTLFLKAPIEKTHVLHRLITSHENKVRIVEPTHANRKGLSVNDALTSILLRDNIRPFQAILLRGRDLCRAAVDTSLRDRIWAYLTDIPQQHEELTPETRKDLEGIFSGCKYILCQTPQIQELLQQEFPIQREKLRILPPMIPEVESFTGANKFQKGSPLLLAYAGKFAPRWGIRELFASVQNLTQEGKLIRLEVFGDKIHNPPDDPAFQREVQDHLQNDKWVNWHGSVDRATLFTALKEVHACWAYRDPTFERSTRELSTKALEYASLGIPTILTRSQIFEDLFGSHYPLFASSQTEAKELVSQLLIDENLHVRASTILRDRISPYTFSQVRRYLIQQGLISK